MEVGYIDKITREHLAYGNLLIEAEEQCGVVMETE